MLADLPLLAGVTSGTIKIKCPKLHCYLGDHGEDVTDLGFESSRVRVDVGYRGMLVDI